jgi:dynein heavy chain
MFVDNVNVKGFTTFLEGSELMNSDSKLPKETLSKRKQVADALPFPAIRYLAGECNYGGRVTDANDRRTLLTILEDFYNRTVINDFENDDATKDTNENNYQFSVLSNSYAMPQLGWLQQNRDYIKSDLPMLDDGPEMYGLHSNANISCALQETTALLDTALSLQPQDSGNGGSGSGKSWSEQVSMLASAIEKRVPTSTDAWDVSLVALKYPVMYEESMNTVLQQELLRFNTLLNIVNSTLIELQKAIKGLVLLSGDLESMGKWLTFFPFLSTPPPIFIHSSSFLIFPISLSSFERYIHD